MRNKHISYKSRECLEHDKTEIKRIYKEEHFKYEEKHEKKYSPE